MKPEMPKFEPIIRQGTWETTTRDLVYEGLLRALQDTGYHVKTANGDTGLIEAEELRVPLKDSLGVQIGIVEYRLTLQILVEKSRAVSVSVQWKGHWKAFPNHETTWGNNYANNEIARRIEEIFATMEQIVGKPSKIDRNVVTWK